MIIDFLKIDLMENWWQKFSNGKVTKEDIDLINTRLLNDGCGNGGNLDLPEDTSNICYACGKNKEIQ